MISCPCALRGNVSLRPCRVPPYFTAQAARSRFIGSKAKAGGCGCCPEAALQHRRPSRRSRAMRVWRGAVPPPGPHRAAHSSGQVHQIQPPAGETTQPRAAAARAAANRAPCAGKDGLAVTATPGPRPAGRTAPPLCSIWGLRLAAPIPCAGPGHASGLPALRAQVLQPGEVQVGPARANSRFDAVGIPAAVRHPRSAPPSGRWRRAPRAAAPHPRPRCAPWRRPAHLDPARARRASSAQARQRLCLQRGKTAGDVCTGAAAPPRPSIAATLVPDRLPA